VRRHFHLQPIRYLMGIEADGRPHTEEGNVIVLDLFIESAQGNAQQISQLLDRQGFLLGAQLFRKGHGLSAQLFQLRRAGIPAHPAGLSQAGEMSSVHRPLYGPCGPCAKHAVSSTGSCLRKAADIHFQNLAGARRRVQESFGFDFADSLAPDEWQRACRVFRNATFLHTRWALSMKSMCRRQTTLVRLSAEKST
jgi:hypothetical protein